MTGHIRVDGAWKNLAGASVRVGGAWKTVQNGYTRIGGVWKEWFSNVKDSFVAAGEGYVYPWNPGFGTLYSRPTFQNTGNALAFSTNSAHFIRGREVWRWNPGFGTKLTNASTSPDEFVSALEFNSTGDRVIAAAGSNGPHAWPWTSSGFGTRFANATGATSVGDTKFAGSGNVIARESTRLRAWVLGASSWGTQYTAQETSTSGVTAIAVNPAGNAVAYIYGAQPGISAYAFNSGFGSKFADPATPVVPVGTSVGPQPGMDFHPAGNAVICAQSFGTREAAYVWNNGFGSKYSAPAGMDVNYDQTQFARFSRTGDSVAIRISSNPFGTPGVKIWAWSAAGYGTRYSNPASSASGVGSTAWG